MTNRLVDALARVRVWVPSPSNESQWLEPVTVTHEPARLAAIPAMAKGGSVSRIVTVLGAQSLVTLPRQLADAIVTEHGVAELRGLSLEACAQALIAIAAPEHRAALMAAWDGILRGS